MDIQAIFDNKLAYIESKISSLGTSTTASDSDFSSILSNKIDALANAGSDVSSTSSTSTDSTATDSTSLNNSTNSPSTLNSSVSSTGVNGQATTSSSTTSNAPVTAYDSIINAASKKYGVDSDLIKAVIKQESDFDSNEVSGAGATGLMQLMPSTAASLGVSNVNDPTQNVDGGTKYLKSLLDNYKDVKLALAAYNAGPNSVNKYNGVPPYSETQNYVNKVINNYNSYKQVSK